VPWCADPFIDIFPGKLLVFFCEICILLTAKISTFSLKYFSLLSNLLGVETLAPLGRLLSSLLLLIAFFAITATLSIFKFVFAELVGFLAC
jgi:hypothetical protein